MRREKVEKMKGEIRSFTVVGKEDEEGEMRDVFLN